MNHFAKLTLLSGALFLAGCIGNNEDPATTTSVSAVASLGAIKNAPFRVLALDGVTEIAAAGKTASDGALPVISLPAGQPFILEIKGAAGATYYDEAKAADVPFLTGTLHVAKSSAGSSLGVSPLTEIAYQRALKLAAGGPLTVGIINSANQSVSLAFGLGDITLAPSLVGSPADLNGLTNTEAGKYAAKLASLAKLAANANGADATPALTLARQLADDLSDGMLDGKKDATDINTPSYAPGTFGADWNTALAAVTNGITDPNAKAALAALAAPSTQLPSLPVAASGVPASGAYNAKISDGSNCAVSVSGNNATVTAAGHTVSLALDGTFVETTGGEREIGPAIFGSGTVRNYMGYTTVGGVLNSIDLNFDGSGKLIYAYASKIANDGPNPPAGVNTVLVCAGEAFTGNLADLPPSGLNAAAPSPFTATALVGNYNAPLNVDGSGSCTFSLDAQGNFSITTASLPNGKMDVPYTALQTNSQTASKVQYEVHPSLNGDWFLFDVMRQADGSTRTGILVNGSLQKTCSTANDPTAKWAAMAAQAGTYTGHTQTTGTADLSNKFNNPCSVTITATGKVTYNTSTGTQIIIGPDVAGASIGKSTNNQGQIVDYLEIGNAALSFNFNAKNVTAVYFSSGLADTCTWP